MSFETFLFVVFLKECIITTLVEQTRDNHSEHVEQLQKVDSVHIEHPHSSEEGTSVTYRIHHKGKISTGFINRGPLYHIETNPRGV